MLFDDPNKLANDEIRDQLKKAGYTLKLTDSIIEQFWFHDWGNSFISFPVYFQILKDFLATTKPTTFSRYDFYEFFYNKTIPEFGKLKTILQRLAMVFELMQTDRLETADFSSLLKELNLPEMLTLEYLRQHNLIEYEEKDGKHFAKWQHHTLTEFLAGEYILRQRDPVKTAEKFMCNSSSGVITFFPSWAGTLRFILEKFPEKFVDWILTCIKINPDFINDQLTEILVFAPSSSIDDPYKAKLFRTVYDTYQAKKWWIPVWAYHNLFKFIDQGMYKDLKDHVDNEDYIYRGNIVATVDGLLQNNHPLITSTERDFWKNKFIEYANDSNTNGVLQRHALAALGNFKGESNIIKQVEINAASSDSLVREAFINMCTSVDPNSQVAIDTFIKVIEDDTAHIYARHALYNIDSLEGIRYFLRQIAGNQKFIHEFLDNESIFNKKEKHADDELLNNIKKNINAEDIPDLQKLIISAFIDGENYKAGDSYFLQQVALIIKSIQPNYLHKLVDTLKGLTPEKKTRALINDIEGVISVLLTPDVLEEMNRLFTDELYAHAGHTLSEAIRLSQKNGNPVAEAVLKKGIELGIVADPNAQTKYDDYQRNQEMKVYKQFQEYLNPGEETRYYTQVFSWYIENKKVIDQYISPVEKERLLKIAVEWNLDKIDPSKIEVHYKVPGTKSGEYTITSYAAYFADTLQVIHLLKPELLSTPQNRRKIIDFIPFTYLSDFKDLHAILGKITDEDLAPVNAVMLDKSRDARYLVPQTYVYIAKTIPGLKSPKEVLISLVEDEFIAGHEREYALEILEQYITSSDTAVKILLKKLWKPATRDSMSDIANGLLISVFHDDEAIKWRFDIIKATAQPFKHERGFHTVGALEHELDSMNFAKPLLELKDEKYLPLILDLLDFSLTIVGTEDHREYVNYLWRLAIAFVVRDNFLLSPKALQTLRKWSEKNKTAPDINWFNKRLEQNTSDTNQSLGKSNSYKEALKQI